jgi:hypothetical protein
MIGSMASIPLPESDDSPATGVDPLQSRLFERHRIEVPVFRGPGSARLLRISAQVYNTAKHYDRLADALGEELSC